MEENEERTLYENLEYLNETKGIIKQAIIDKGVEISADTPFREYADKISDITTGEDLEAELSAQEQVIQQMKTALENKTAGGKVKLNVYAQTTEPTNKDGIWLQTDKQIDNYIAVDSININEGWGDVISYMPYSFCDGTAILVGDYIYIFGFWSNWNKAYKYNIITKEYSPLSDTPVSTRDAKCAFYNNGIYIFCNNKNIYYYDIENNTYRALDVVCPITVSNLFCYDDNYAYMGYDGKLYKFDLHNQTFTLISSTIGFDYMYGQIYNNHIYYIVKFRQTGIYKVNLSTGVTTQLLSTLPSPISSSTLISPSVCIYNDILYIFSPYYDGSSSNKCYKYNISTNTLTQLTDGPEYYNYAPSFVYNGNIWIIGGSRGTSNVSNKIRQYNIAFDYEGDKDNICFVTQKSGTYSTTLIPIENFIGLKYKFNNVYYYTIENGLDDTIPTYYGDGIQWIKFKN